VWVIVGIYDVSADGSTCIFKWLVVIALTDSHSLTDWLIDWRSLCVACGRKSTANNYISGEYLCITWVATQHTAEDSTFSNSRQQTKTCWVIQNGANFNYLAQSLANRNYTNKEFKCMLNYGHASWISSQ